MKHILLLCITLIASNLLAQKKSKKENAFFLKVAINTGSISSKAGTGAEPATSDGRIGFGISLEHVSVISEKLLFSKQIALNARGYKNVKTTYLDVPIAFNYLLGKSNWFMIGLGGYVGILLNGKYQTLASGWQKFKIGESSTDTRSRFDAGLVINGALMLNDGYPIVQFSGMFGLKNVISKDRQINGNRNRLNNAELGFHIPFRLFKK